MQDMTGFFIGHLWAGNPEEEMSSLALPMRQSWLASFAARLEERRKQYLEWIQRDVVWAAQQFDIYELGWAKRINRDTLDMSSFGTCMLGQLYGGYWRAKCLSRMRFQSRGFEFVSPSAREFWLKEIDARLAA